jgi:hypothetical protein
VFDRKKLNFWRLALGFMGFTMITLMFLWLGPQSPKAQMMTGSMGKMMTEIHAQNLTVYDFFADSIPEDHSAGEAENHHENASSAQRTVNFLTTATVFLLLPLILGGAIVLAIVWFK